MKFLPLLSAVLVSLAFVSADSPAAVGAEKGKVPQLLELINKFEHANPSSPAFLAEYASEIPTLAKLHREVVAQAGEKQVRRLYGDNEAARKLLELVEGVKTEEKREVKEKKVKKVKENKGTKGKSEAAHKKAEEKKKAAAAKKDKKVHPAHPPHPATHGDMVNKHKQGEKQSTAHKSSHASHPNKAGAEKIKRDDAEAEVKVKKTHPAHPVHPQHPAHPAHPEHPAHPVHPVHPVHPSTHGDSVNHHQQGAKQSAAHKSTHATHKKESKKPAHKHTSKKGVKSPSS